MNITTTVGEIVRAKPATARIFESLGIDYCCGGKKPLAELCRAKGLDAATVLTMLAALEHLPAAGAAPIDPDTMGLAQLCDHIQQAHHHYLREELPRLDFLTTKVAAVHGEHEPRLRQLRKVFETFNAEMTVHTDNEDNNIFPAIRDLEAKGKRSATAASLKASLEQLEREHDSAGAALEQFVALSDNYTAPEWACNTFRALYDSLAELQRNMHQHVHKENNILFPKARALAAKA